MLPNDFISIQIRIRRCFLINYSDAQLWIMCYFQFVHYCHKLFKVFSFKQLKKQTKLSKTGLPL